MILFRSMNESMSLWNEIEISKSFSHYRFALSSIHSLLVVKINLESFFFHRGAKDIWSIASFSFALILI